MFSKPKCVSVLFLFQLSISIFCVVFPMLWVGLNSCDLYFQLPLFGFNPHNKKWFFTHKLFPETLCFIFIIKFYNSVLLFLRWNEFFNSVGLGEKILHFMTFKTKIMAKTLMQQSWENSNTCRLYTVQLGRKISN